MNYFSKTLEELDVIDDFLMNAIVMNEEVGVPFCKRVLSVLLQKQIGEIKIAAQRTLPPPVPGLRGIRMDVEIMECVQNECESIASVYDIEPHLQKDLCFPKRNRFYQAKIDSRFMKSGEVDFSKMPNLYVIIITNFDPFGYDYMMYTIKNRCIEEPSLNYQDGLQFIYFNTQGTKGGSKEIKTMLKYLQDSRRENAINEATKEVHDYVSRVKILPEVRDGYMKFEEIIALARKDEREETTLFVTQNSILELLEEYSVVPKELEEKIKAQKNMETLKAWHKLAAKAGSIEEFKEKIS